MTAQDIINEVTEDLERKHNPIEQAKMIKEVKEKIKNGKNNS